MRSWVPHKIAPVVGVLALSAFSQSCLLAPPDPLEEPQRIPPRAMAHDAVPAITRIFQTRVAGDDPSFNVPFVSEDLGEPVVGRLFLNYPNGRFLAGQEVLPGILDDVREMKVTWGGDRSFPAGCYTITMTITHQDNYGADTYPEDESKTAFITWWIAHDIIDLQSINLDECTPPQIAAQ